MKIHKTEDESDSLPVLYRHAKCKACEHEFTYWIGSTPDDGGTRPPCPSCDEQGIGGPFGRVNPAEYLPIIQQAAAGSPFEYRHWLADIATLRIDYVDAMTGDPKPRWFYVNREPVADLPCYTTRAVNADGVVSNGWKPHIYQNYLDNGVEMTLVPTDDRPEEDWGV